MTMTPLPSPPSTSDPANFATKADALLAALPNFVTEANALSNGLNFPGLMANSTTSVAIGTGSKSFTIDTGKTFVAGQSIIVQYTTTPTNWMYGTVTSYNSGTGALVMNVTSVLGSGTYALWTVSLGDALVSARGFSMSGGINTARGTVAMHATTMDLWSQANIIDGTGSAVTITAIVNAPQAGARRILYPIAGTIITHGATFSVDGNASYTTAAGDALVFEAVTTSTYGVGIIKQDGTPITASLVVPVRQTVLQGPVDTAGLPTFLPATSGNLNLTSQNVSTGANALVMTAAQGANLYGAINAVGQSTSNLTWTGCTANLTNYLPVLVNADGTLTPQTPVTPAPIYQWGGTPSVTANQYTFNIQQMTMYKGNGTTAPAVNHVIVGEAVAGASTITSTVAYAYMGQYDSGFTATLPAASASVSKNSNLGVKPRTANVIIECTTTDNGYAVGDQMIAGYLSGGSYYSVPVWSTTNTVGFSTGVTNAAGSIPKGGSTVAALTVASWKYKLIANRGW